MRYVEVLSCHQCHSPMTYYWINWCNRNGEDFIRQASLLEGILDFCCVYFNISKGEVVNLWIVLLWEAPIVIAGIRRYILVLMFRPTISVQTRHSMLVKTHHTIDVQTHHFG